jgi:GntR family transcriptional regulator
MNIIVSNSSDVPLYMQIKEQIKDAILKGELKDGELLPSIRNLANDVQVSVLTIRRVYDELEKEGFAVSRTGKGTFVSMGNQELLRDSKRRMVEQDLQKAVHNAKLFGITKDEMTEMLDILYEED